jgi:acyl-CoA hydrolase
MLMQWIDVVAGVVARRHSNAEVTTACVDNLRFKEAVYVNSTIVLIGEMTYVGNTSMEVRVDTFVEDIMGMRRSVNRAYVVLVALDDNENPIEVPGLLIQTEKEKFEWEAGKKRYELRKKRRVERF